MKTFTAKSSFLSFLRYTQKFRRYWSIIGSEEILNGTSLIEQRVVEHVIFTPEPIDNQTEDTKHGLDVFWLAALLGKVE